MIETDKRKAVFLLHQEGHSVREIARLLSLSRNTVRTIIVQGGTPPKPQPRADKLALDEELLRRLYQQCQGRMARVHEKLVEEEGVQVTYPTLTRRLRELGISNPQKPRCDRVPDEPGLEMQHDTSLYHIELGGRRVKLLASLIFTGSGLMGREIEGIRSCDIVCIVGGRSGGQVEGLAPAFDFRLSEDEYARIGAFLTSNPV